MTVIDRISFSFRMTDEQFARDLYADWDGFCRRCVTDVMEDFFSPYDTEDSRGISFHWYGELPPESHPPDNIWKGQAVIRPVRLPQRQKSDLRISCIIWSTAFACRSGAAVILIRPRNRTFSRAWIMPDGLQL